MRWIFALIMVHVAIYWVYWWQVKEYRWDRMKESLTTIGLKILGQQFNLLKWYRPKLTIRATVNLMAVGLVILGLVIFNNELIGLIATPIWVSLLVFIFDPIFRWQKNKLIDRAKQKMRGFKGLVIGVTGSYGKSMTKELLVWLLVEKYKVGNTPKNVNSEIGVAQTVLGLKGNEELLVIEMGAYRIGEIKAICDIVRPRVGVLTGLGDQHLALFGSLENIKKAKYELIDSLPKDSLGIVAERDFSLKDAGGLKQNRESLEFVYKKIKFELPLLGKELARNVVAAIIVGEWLKIDLEYMAKRLSQFPTQDIRPRLIKLTKKITLIDDGYNASTESFLSLIDYAQSWEGVKRILITPGMIELGKNGSIDHQKVGKELGIFDSVYLTNKNWLTEMNQSDNVIFEGDLKKIINKIKADYNNQEIVVFVKGRISGSLLNLWNHE